MKPYTEDMLGHHEARVKDDAGKLLAACRHAHRTRYTAQACAEKMARRAGWRPLRLYSVRTLAYGKILREDTSIREARRWAEQAFPGLVLAVEYVD